MGRNFAITDIHGCAKTFIALVENVVQLKKSDTLYLLGDYIDRGPDSKGVIDYILQLKETGFNLICLRGNHEDILLKCLPDSSMLSKFISNGGDKTLNSFGVDHPLSIPLKYIQFFNSTLYYSLYENFILVHAGVDGEAEDPFADKEFMLWTRKYKLGGKVKDKVVVHGHTPIPLMEIQDKVKNAFSEQDVDIDNGCVYGLNEFYGNLVCLELDTLKLYIQPNIDQKPQF